MRTTYWSDMANQKPLPSMRKPCEDCAIVYEFYTSHADDLLKQPKEIQEKVMKTWFCHNHPNRCCKGLEDYMNKKRRKNENIEIKANDKL